MEDGNASGQSPLGMQSKKNLNQRRLALETDPQFNKDLSSAIDNLKRMPRYKNKVWDKITGMHQRLEEERGHMGIEAGEIFTHR